MRKVSLLFFGLFSYLSASAVDVAFKVSQSKKSDSLGVTTVWYDVQNKGAKPITVNVRVEDKATSRIAEDDFGICGNNLYLLPNKTGTVKVTYYGVSNIEKGQYNISFKANGSVQKIDLFNATNSVKPASVSLKRISTDQNGMLKAVTQK